MKKLIMIASVIATTLFTGCTPSAEQINKTASAIGTAAGLVANQTKVDDVTRNTIVQILGEVRECVPGNNQSFVDAWSPVIDSKIAQLVAAGKITAVVGTIVKPIAVMAAEAIDYTFDRYPKAKKSEELVRAGATGVIDGFLTVFKPVNTVAAGSKPVYDEKAYEYFQKKLSK